MTLYFLSHPDSDLFSGYGIPADGLSRAHLYGLIMIDRPYPVSTEWLADVYDAFGELALFTITPSGHRGLFCQLLIRGDSIEHVAEKRDPIVPYLERALKEYSRPVPRARLEAWWDAGERLWRTQIYRQPRLFRLIRASYGRRDTPPDDREYYIDGWGSAVGTTREIADFIRRRLGVEEFVLDLYDPISEPDRNLRIEFREGKK